MRIFQREGRANRGFHEFLVRFHSVMSIYWDMPNGYSDLCAVTRYPLFIFDWFDMCALQ